MNDREWGFKTRAIHAGGGPDISTGARNVPVYQTTSFVFEDTRDAADMFALQNLDLSTLVSQTLRLMPSRKEWQVLKVVLGQ